MTKDKHLLMFFTAMATGFGQAVAVEPQPIRVGGLAVTPTLMVSEAYDDNVFNAPGKEVDSMVTSLAPSLMISAQDGFNFYQLKYDVLSERVHSSDEDSHTDHDVSAQVHLEFNSRHRLDLGASYVKQTARRDTTNRLFDETGNKSESVDVGAKYGFGAESATAQIELGLNYGQLRYDNNFNSGSLTREKERDTASADITFYYRVGPKTRLLAETIYTDYDYESSTSTLSGDSTIYRVGVEWKATAKTTGRISVGKEKKNFDTGPGSDVSKPSWAASISWQPRTYSTFTVSSYRLIEEGSSTETFIETTATELTWDHDWTARLGSHFSYGFINQEYSGLSNSGRDDDIDTLSAGLNYQMLRWLNVGLYYKYNNTDSNDSNSEYERNVFGINATMTL